MIAQALSRIIHCIATITGFEHESPDTHEHAL